MSEVNREIYPIRESSLSELSVTIKMSEIPDQTLDNWDTSIAVSESMSKNAPFNCINCLTVENNSGPMHSNFRSNDIQKIALYYLESTVNYSGANNRYYNGTINYIFLGRAYEFQAIIYGGKYAPRGWEVTSNFAQYYHPERYYLIDGLKIQNVVCVICVLFTDNSYCSLKYYNDNKQTISNTPMSLFMIGIYGDAVTNSKQNFCPVNMVKNKYDFWRYRNGNFESGIAEAALKYPFGAGTLNAFGDAYGAATAPSDVFPLVACFQGTAPLSKYNWWISSLSVSSVFVIGGVPNEHYVINDSSQFNPVLTQKAFDEAHSIAATYGLPFRDDFPSDMHNVGSGGTVFMPIANDGGYFNGRFETLSVNGVVSADLTQQNFELWNGEKSDIFNKRTYDPNIPIPTDNIDLTQPTMTAIDAFNRTYIIDGNSVDDLGALLWSGDQSFLDSVLKSFELYGEKPINGIINLMLFPFDVREKTGAAVNETIKIGRYDTQIAAYRLPTNARAIYDFGSFKWEKEFDNFLDFEPFTTAELYVPFFGMFPLQNSHFIGKTIDIKVAVDFITGAATCIIYVSDKGIRHPVIYKNATLGIQIPVTGDDVSDRVNTILNNAMGVVPDVADMAKSAVTKDVGGLVKSAISAEVHSFGVDAVPTMYQTAGASTPECSLYLPKKPYIILYTPEIVASENYNNCIGYATFEDVTIGDCHGFCKFDNIDLSNIIATDAEKMQIASALTGGVYL